MKKVHCSDENHIDAVNKPYGDIVNSLIQYGEQIMLNDKKNYTHLNLDELSVSIMFMTHLEKLDKCGLMLSNPDRCLYMTCM